MKTKAAKIQQFLLQQQLPDDIRVTNNNTITSQRASSSTTASSTSSLPPSSSAKFVTASDHVHQLALETCQCVHLQEYLPHILDLELVRAVKHPRGYLVANPVHSLHLASQLEHSNPASARAKPPPILYGEEQQRTMAMQTEGVVEYWCPLSGYDSVIRDDTSIAEPTLEAKQQEQQQQSEQTPSSSSSETTAPALKKVKIDAAEPVTVTSSDPAAKESDDQAKPLGAPHASFATASAKEEKPLEAIEHNSSAAAAVDASVIVIKTSPTDGSAATTKKVEMDTALATDADADNTENLDIVMAPSKETPATNSKDTLTQKEELTTTTSAEEKLERDGINTGMDPKVVNANSAESIEATEMEENDKMDTTEKEEDDKMDTTEKDDDASTSARKYESSPADADKTKTEQDKVESTTTPEKDKSGENTEQQQKDSSLPRLNQSLVEKVQNNVAEFAVADEGKSPESKVTVADQVEAAPMKDETRAVESTADESKVVEGYTKTDHNGIRQHPVEGNNLKDAQHPQKPPTDTGSNGIEDVVQKNAVLTPDPSPEAKDVKVGVEAPKGNAETERVDDEKADATVGAALVATLPLPSSSLPNNKPKEGDNAVKPAQKKEATEISSASGFTLTKLGEGSSSVEMQAASEAVVQSASASIPAVPDPASSASRSGGGDLKEPIPVVAISERASDQPVGASKVDPAPASSDPSLDHIYHEEDRIKLIRRSLSVKRIKKKSESKDISGPATGTKKKRKRDVDVFKPNGIRGWKASTPKELNSEQEEEWMGASRMASETIERWLGNYRMCRDSYWMEKKQAEKGKFPKQSTFYLQEEQSPPEGLKCQICSLEKSSKCVPVTRSRKEARVFSGDELSMIRIDSSKKLEYMGWKEHAVLRSFDAFDFLKTQDHGIVWRGLIATYPPLVPKEHFLATQLTLRRQSLFEGKSEEDWVLLSPASLRFAASQHGKSNEEKYGLAAPVGIYNHGNTCYMSSILQCLVFCRPLQDYFLKHFGHHHKACEVYRHETDAKSATTKMKVSALKTKKAASSSIKGQGTTMEPEICLACEMDRLFLSYFGSANGVDMHSCIEESSQHLLLGKSSDESFQTNSKEFATPAKGSPLMITNLITSAWKCGGMEHLAGYEQRDAHEFLNAFLELLGKHIVKFRERIHSSVTRVDEENALVPKPIRSKIGE
ncbi:MAG: hypothetical protein SGILL_002988 [Bacillariaceae sp.]